MGDKSVRFDGTVTLGNVLTLVSMLATVFTLWRNMETRIVLMEERLSVQTRSLEKVVDQVERMAIVQAAADRNNNHTLRQPN